MNDEQPQLNKEQYKHLRWYLDQEIEGMEGYDEEGGLSREDELFERLMTGLSIWLAKELAQARKDERQRVIELVEKHRINLGARRASKIYKDNEEQYWYDKGQTDEANRVVSELKKDQEGI